MALTTDRQARVGHARRLVGPDVVRAVALIGVILMNYHGSLILRGAPRGDGPVDRFFDPWTGPLATRFAATFVLVAGVGVTLMTRGAVGDPAAMTARRWVLVRRGLLLYGVGLVFDEVWPGTILPYYGAMFLLAALICTWRSRWVLAVGASAAVAGAAIRWWRVEAAIDGRDTTWLTSPGPGSPRGLLLDVAVNGTHPLLPWLAFFCAGIVLGRLLTTPWWRPVAIGAGATMFTFATLFAGSVTTGRRAIVLAGSDPLSRSLVYTASALGTALVAFGVITALAERAPRSPAVAVLASAGRLTLTLYLAHAFVFLLLVDWLSVVDGGGLGTALALSLCCWIVAVGAGSAWQRRFGIGPAEWVYRRIGG